MGEVWGRVWVLLHDSNEEPGEVQTSSGLYTLSHEVQINLRLILVSGKTKEFLFSPNDSASDIAKHVYDNWPMDWEEEQVSSPNILRLIYQGRFLHGNVTLGALKLPFGKTTVMHLVARETLPEPNSQGQRNREKTGESNCCVIL
uniref:Ubiquitin like 3 n=1 Tax=Felis catus TaxID=9685 RepID=A0ABI7Z5D4_FELCA